MNEAATTVAAGTVVVTGEPRALPATVAAGAGADADEDEDAVVRGVDDHDHDDVDACAVPDGEMKAPEPRSLSFVRLWLSEEQFDDDDEDNKEEEKDDEAEDDDKPTVAGARIGTGLCK